MRRHRFVVSEVPAAGELRLSGPEHEHLAWVLRLGPGDEVHVFDGRGTEASAIILRVGRRETELGIRSLLDDVVESPLRTVLLQSLATADRVDQAVRRCTELGVSEIVLLRSDRTASSGQGRRAPRMERLERIALEAAKQCGRRIVPSIAGPVDVRPWPDPPAEGIGILLDGRAAASLREVLARTPARTSIALAVGPEGGWSDGDRDAARRAGFRAARLGPRTLRTETAGPAALALAQAAWGDLG